MNSIFNFRTYELSFRFAKPYLWISFLVTVFMVFSGSVIFKISNLNAMILSFKILFYLGVFLSYFDIAQRKRLTFYQNFGLSKIVLILISLLMDIALTLVFINLIRLF
ncbi:hypothetical protein SAMN03080594_109138 [Arenibacter palladensis]|uniref:Uncharacterized protein n=1 Tax=Arenibacter palladensis TaxID=237373 RepID=A0A1M5FMR9_9FLAO|nr:hypothetical protein SAMN03080594_109138 [Arenibacter palladensis]